MKVCVVSPPGNQVYGDKYAWVVRGFEQAGHRVIRAHDFKGVLLADGISDLVLLVNYCGGLDRCDVAEYAPRRKARWAMWWFDLLHREMAKPLGEQDLVSSYLPAMRAVDFVLVKERSCLDDYRALGINAYYMDQGCPADMAPTAHADSPRWDVAVLGAIDRPQRLSDVQALVRAGVSVAWAARPGPRPLPAGVTPLPWTQPNLLPYLLGSAALGLSVDYTCDIDGYSSDRTYLLAGMGACVLHRRGLYSPSLPMLQYRTEAELVRLAKEMVAAPSERRALGRHARRYVLEGHTYAHRARSILKILAASGAAK